MTLDLLLDLGEECAYCCRELGVGLVALDSAGDFCCLACARRLLAAQAHAPACTECHDAPQLADEPEPSPELVAAAKGLLAEFLGLPAAAQLHDDASTMALAGSR